jgi:acetylornithine deacetylase/succinyl-diaminopimelate desuccinylase-like protein
VKRAAILGAALGAVVGLSVIAAEDKTVAVSDLMRDPSVKQALDIAKKAEPQAIDDQVRFCEVPAPSFKEAARGALLRRAFEEAGLLNVRVDKAGNIIGDRPGASARPRLVLAAHLDTVFPEGTEVRVTRKGPILYGPGIGDDCRGLAVLVAVARALNRAQVKTRGTITFVADVGEEGLGDLRGVKDLFGETLKNQIDRFVSIDTPGFAIVTSEIGSHRYRVTFRGRGGHSFADFGVASPIGAMGRAIARISNIQVPDSPRTTYNVGRVGGGMSINSIASESWMELEARSTDSTALTALDDKLQQAIDGGVAEENARWNTPGAITAKRELVGDRAAASTPQSAPIVRTAIAASSALGLTAGFGEGSTDANVPMSLHIPAITIGYGGRGMNIHTPGESYDTTDSSLGTMRALLLAVALAQK